MPHVLSALALFVALGGSAIAVGIAKNSVGSPQIKRGAVRTSDLRNGSVTTRKLRANAVTGGKVRNGSLRGVDIDQSTLDSVRAANITSVSAEGDGNCTLINPPAGVTAAHQNTGTCVFTFNRDVSDCGAVASVDQRYPPNVFVFAGARDADVSRYETLPNELRTTTYFDPSAGNPGDDGTPNAVDFAVTLVVIC